MTQTPIKVAKGKTFTHLVSKEGGVKYPLKALNVCEETFSPLEVAYDYDEIRRQVSRESIAAGASFYLALQSIFACRKRKSH